MLVVVGKKRLRLLCSDVVAKHVLCNVGPLKLVILLTLFCCIPLFSPFAATSCYFSLPLNIVCKNTQGNVG